MPQVIDIRSGRVIEHTDALPDAWAWAEFCPRVAISWLEVMKSIVTALEEEVMETWMRDQANRDGRKVIRLDEYRRETRRFSGVRQAFRRRHHDGDDLPPAA